MASTPNSPNRPADGFELVRETPFPSLAATLCEFRHVATGCKHLHLTSADSVNAFVVGVFTPAPDNSGLTHVLEHLLLCGGRGFATRAAFFDTLARSACLTMNAHASDDCSSFHFATAHRQDFYNLLEVYLDCLFRPRLDAADFLQEGHRIDRDNNAQSVDKFRHRSVVLSEMQGAMGLPTIQLQVALKHHLFANSAYRFNSGGNPRSIIELQLQQLRDYHQRFYHPAEAIFVSAGNLPPAEHQCRIEDIALAAWASQPAPRIDRGLAQVSRFSGPVQITEPVAIDESSQSAVAWLLDDCTSVDALHQARLVESLVVSSPTSMARSLFAREPGNKVYKGQLSAISGLDISRRQMSLCIAVQGSDPAQTADLEQELLHAIEASLQESAQLEHADAALDRIERSLRIRGSQRYPYSLHCLAQLLVPVMHGGNAADHLEPLPALQRLRNEVQQPGYLASLIEQQLLNNPHRLRLDLVPQHGTARRDHLPAPPTDAPTDRPPAHDRHQDQHPNLLKMGDLQAKPLPMMSLDQLQLPSTSQSPPAQHLRERTLIRRIRATHAMVHLRLAIRVPTLEPDLAQALPTYVAVLEQLANDKIGGAHNAALQICNSVEVKLAVQAAHGADPQAMVAVTLAASTQSHHAQALAERLHALLDHDPEVSAQALAKVLQGQQHTLRERLLSRGHESTQRAAGSAISVTAALDERLQGLSALRRLSSLLDGGDVNEPLAALPAQLLTLAARLRRCHRYVLEVCDQPAHREPSATTQSLDTGFGDIHKDERWRISLQPSAALSGHDMPTSVGFVGRAVASVPPKHADAPALAVLGARLNPSFLHQRIRERGGAYGTGASYNLSNGLFALFSYRDPNPRNTLSVFDDAIAWLYRTPTNACALQQAKLAVIRDLDRSSSAIELAAVEFDREVAGSSTAARMAFRDAVLEVNEHDLHRAVEAQLQDAKPSSVIIANKATLDSIPGCEIQP